MHACHPRQTEWLGQTGGGFKRYKVQTYGLANKCEGNITEV